MTTTNENQASDRASWFMQLQELFDARLAMAQLEVRHDIATLRRQGIVAGSGAIFALTGLPLLVIVLAQVLASLTEVDVFWWQLIFGGGLFLCGSLLMALAWRTFRRNFSGLRETKAELNEDRLWLRELAGEFAGRSDN